MDYHGRVVIDAPPERVFPYLHDPARLRRWLGGFIESRPETAGGLRVGARSTDVFEEGGRRIEMTTEITELDPDRSMGVLVENRMIRAANRYALRAEGGGTVLELFMDARLKGWLRLLGPFLRGVTRRRNNADLARLKAAVETGEP